jgi:ComF family protein
VHLADLAAGLLDLLWPPRCPACDRALGRVRGLCETCRDSLLTSPVAIARAGLRARAAWSQARAAFLYGGQLAVAILRAKTVRDGALARELGRIVASVLPEHDLAVPVPLHPRRLRARGFNQSAELLRGAGAGPTVGLLVRMRDTPPQTGRPRWFRLHNVRGAFEVRVPARVRGRRVLLLDDVMTTGATADACARALARAGAAAVTVLVLARVQA